MELTSTTERQGSTRGFSLLELLVVIGIFSMISVVILANHSRFNSSILLTSLAYDIALSVRQAQVYGLSVRGGDFGDGTTFQAGYGIRFFGNNSYVFFADTNKSKTYDEDDAIISTYTLRQGHSILRYCVTPALGDEQCSDTGAITELDIVFVRPNPDAAITIGGATLYSQGKVVIAAGTVATRTVVVASTGQISVQNPPMP